METDEEFEVKVHEKRSIFEVLSFIVAGVSCLGGLASIIVPLALDKKIPVESLYWFTFALVAVIFPYIKEITFKVIVIQKLVRIDYMNPISFSVLFTLG